MKRNILPLLASLFISILYSSCGISNYQTTRDVKVKGTPNTDFYVYNQRSFASSDGFYRNIGANDKVSILCDDNVEFIGSTDDTGVGIVKLSTEDYRKSKRIVGMQTGYQPTRFKLKKRFNNAVLYDVFFPVAFFFDRYKVLSKKRTNKVELKKTDTTSAIDYFNQAFEETNPKNKLKLYQNAIAQDYRNENGIRALAINNMAIIYAEKGETHRAYLLFKQAQRLDSSCGATENMEWLQGVVNKQINIAAAKQAKWDRAMNTLNTIGSGLQNLGSSLEAQQTSSTATVTSQAGQSGKGNASPNVSTSKTNGSAGHPIQETTNKNTDSRTYSNYETQLISMNTNYARDYNNARRIQIQQKMKQIREKWEQRGYQMFHSRWEDWDGSKQ